MLLMTFIGCQKEYFPQPPLPKVAKQTSTLEASYSPAPSLNINDKFWKQADFLKVTSVDINKGLLYTDGLLNMTGTYNGMSEFNAGKDPNMIMKAAYDNNKIYVYVEWTDSDLNPQFGSSIWNGHADPLKSDTANDWTSQGNSDRLALAFDISGASSSAGTFVEKGCAASCHNNQMQPATGTVDIWNWSLALSEPLGYASDMVADATNGLTSDAGQKLSVRNKVDIDDDRSAPAYEWDGTDQTLTRPDGKTTTLDPTFYLLNKTPFLGNIKTGDAVYHFVGTCDHCHGEYGEGGGEGGDGPAFADLAFGGKYSRAMIKNFASSNLHDGHTFFNDVPVSSQDDLIAYIKGLASLPGNYLTQPDGSSADIWTVSNINRTKINIYSLHTVYKILLVRNLTTNNSDDAQFTLPEGKSFPFGVALMDNDGKNHVGSLKEILTFKSKGL